MGDHAIWEFNKGQKALAHRRPLAVTTRFWYPAYAWIASMGYESKVSDLFLDETLSTAPVKLCKLNGLGSPSAAPLFLHVLVPNIYGTSSSIYLIVLLRVISNFCFSTYRTNNISRRKNIVFGGCGELTPPEIYK
jgi:hypothetical protein